MCNLFVFPAAKKSYLPNETVSSEMQYRRMWRILREMEVFDELQ